MKNSRERKTESHSNPNSDYSSASNGEISKKNHLTKRKLGFFSKLNSVMILTFLMFFLTTTIFLTVITIISEIFLFDVFHVFHIMTLQSYLYLVFSIQSKTEIRSFSASRAVVALHSLFKSMEHGGYLADSFLQRESELLLNMYDERQKNKLFQETYQLGREIIKFAGGNSNMYYSISIFEGDAITKEAVEVHSVGVEYFADTQQFVLFAGNFSAEDGAFSVVCDGYQVNETLLTKDGRMFDTDSGGVVDNFFYPVGKMRGGWTPTVAEITELIAEDSDFTYELDVSVGENFQIEPWFVVSINRPLTYNSPKYPNVYKTGIWYGMRLNELSTFLQKLHTQISLSSTALSWIFEKKRNVLIGTSDLFNNENNKIVNAEQWRIISPQEYEGNSLIGLISTHVLNENALIYGNPDDMGAIPDGMKHYNAIYGGYDVQVVVYNASEYGMEFYFIQIELMSTIYSGIYNIIFILSIFFVFFIAILLMWTVGLYLLQRAFYILFREVKKVKVLDLENVNIQTKWYTFYEIAVLNNVINTTVMKLKKFRDFLPMHIRKQNFQEQKGKKKGKKDVSQSELDAFSFGMKKEECILLMFCYFSKFESLRLEESYQSDNSNNGDESDESSTSMEGESLMIRFFRNLFRSISRFDGKIIRFSDSKIYVKFAKFKLSSVISCIKAVTRFDKMIYTYIVKDVVYAGNVGSDNFKNYCVEGIGMEKLCGMYRNIPANLCKDLMFLCDEEVQKELKDDFEERFVDKFEIQYKDFPVSFNVFQIGREMKVSPAEWMYELKQKEGFKRWNVYKKAIKQYQKAEYDNAEKSMKKFCLNNDGNDKLGNYWMRKLAKRKERKV